MTLLHRIAHRNMVTGQYNTRCGLTGSIDYASPRPSGAVFMLTPDTAIADGEIATTCKKCILKLTPTQKKILRLLFDRHIVNSIPSHAFRWHGNTIWAKNKDMLRLIALGLIHGLQLTAIGRQLAPTFPKVQRGNTLHRVSRRRVQSRRKNMGKA